MNFKLAETLFFFSIKTAKLILDFLKPTELISKSDSDFLLQKSAKIGSLIDSIYQDKKIDLGDIPEVVGILKEATGLIGFNFEEAAIQIANATKEELDESFRKFDEEFTISDKNKEANLEIIFHEIFNIINSGNRIIKICKKIK